MLTTWTLWNALKKPFVMHPVFYRAMQLRKAGVGEVSFFVRPTQRFLQRIRSVTRENFFARIGLVAAARVTR